MDIDWDNAKPHHTHYCTRTKEFNATGMDSDSTTCRNCMPRPIRTKEQRERDELIEIILTDGDLSAGMLADVIISAGYRKPENE